MMNEFKKYIRKKLSRKIITVLTLTVAITIGVEIYLRVIRGVEDRINMMKDFGRELAASVYAGIKHPMSVGDSSAIKQQLLDIKEKMGGGYVFISDFNQKIIYATHEEKINTVLKNSIHNNDALLEIDYILKTGSETQRAFEEEENGKRYLITMHPILNQVDCHHCHGYTRKVLGSMIIKMSTDRTYKAIMSSTQKSIIISIVGLVAFIYITYVMLAKFVSRPIEILAEKAKRFAEGDMSVHAPVTTEDEIGVLSNTFNYMVKKISSFSKELEIEVARRTMMLKEKTLLLERANRELRELDRLKSAFLANMSHELRTPLNSIIGYTDLLIDEVDGPVNEEQAKSLHKIEKNARHLLQLINDILDMSKIESGKIQLDIKELQIKTLIESVTATFEPVLNKKGLSLDIEIDNSLPNIYADSDKVTQILVNLISNAIKFTNSGGIKITAKPSKRGIKQGETPLFAEICVEDTGIGIKDEDISKLFDKFSQLDISSVRQYEGTGLGLSIARGLVVLHKGVIWVTSQYGKGSKFCFTLPLKREILEKPAQPIIETDMAKGLAEYFKKPVDLFLRQPMHAGKPVKCWEYVHCGQTSCPVYGSEELRCWLVFGTHCKGIKVAAYPEKVDFCKGCEIIERLILESEEFAGIEELEKKLQEEGVGCRKTVLVIDDNIEAIEIIRKFLGKDYDVVSMLTGIGAVDAAKAIKPVAITLDIMMPMKDGWHVLQELKSDPETQDIPVIVLSIVDEKQYGFSLGATDYIVKPVEKDILLKKLRRIESFKKILKVLVVENEIDTLKSIAETLKDVGYDVITSVNSSDAIVAIRDSHPDLVILNLTMPEIKGFDVIEYLKSDESVKNIPLIVITKKDLSDEEIERINGRIQLILNKGILSEEEILEELKKTINTTQYV